MEPLITLLILVVFIGITAWIFETKILGALPISEPWNWLVRLLFWLIVIIVLWKFVYPLVQAVV